jgi:hypothetical protein
MVFHHFLYFILQHYLLFRALRLKNILSHANINPKILHCDRKIITDVQESEIMQIEMCGQISVGKPDEKRPLLRLRCRLEATIKN